MFIMFVELLTQESDGDVGLHFWQFLYLLRLNGISCCVRKRRGQFCVLARFPFSNIQGHSKPNTGAVNFPEEAPEHSLLSSLNGAFTSSLAVLGFAEGLRVPFAFECFFTSSILNFS